MPTVKRIIRAFFVVLLILAVGLPVAVYLLLATPWAQDKIRQVAVGELTELFGTRLDIDRIDYEPFNSLAITGIRLADDEGRPAAAIATVQARFDLWHFLRTRRMVFDYAMITGPELHLSRATPQSPLNVQPILDRLKPKEPRKPSQDFSLKISTVILRDGRFTYDVLSEPDSLGRFNPNHISVGDLDLHAYLRHASKTSYDAVLESFSFSEKSGLELSDLVVDALVTDSLIQLRELRLEMPGSALSLNPLQLKINGFGDIAHALRTQWLTLSPAEEITIDTRDFAWLSPELGRLDRVLTADFEIEGSMREVDINRLTFSDSHGLKFALSGKVERPDSLPALKADIDLERLSAPASDVSSIIARFNPKAAAYAGRAGNISLKGNIKGSLEHADVDIEALIGEGALTAVATATSPDRFKSVDFEGDIGIDGLELGTILDEPRLGSITARLTAGGSLARKQLTGEGQLEVVSAHWDGHDYTDIHADISHDGTISHLTMSSADPDLDFDLDVEGDLLHSYKSLMLRLMLHNFAPDRLNIKLPREGLTASGQLSADLHGQSLDDIEGRVALTDLHFTDASGDSLTVHSFAVTASRSLNPETIEIQSDFLNGSIEGTIRPTSLGAVFKDFASHIVPALLPHDEGLHDRLSANDLHNKFHIDLTLGNAEHLSRFLRLPVQVIYDVDIKANVDSEAGIANLTLDAPYLQQGDKIIDSTVAGVYVKAHENRATVYATTHMPTKKGPMTAVLGIRGSDNRFNTLVDWEIERKIPLNGKIDFSTALSRAESGDVCVDTHFNPGQINFGDDVWEINPADIRWCDKRLTIDDFALTAGDQRVSIEGVASASYDDEVKVWLNKIKLISIFETLEIDNALLCGTATGTFSARQALSKLPVLTTDNLHVDDIGYNYCVLGDGDIRARWDNDRQSFYLDADIVNPEKQHSRIWGDIFASTQSLDLNFEANHVKVGFMQPFMSAFASDISGFASGHARLFGTFSDIDMEGDIFAQDLRLRIDFTNTFYTATDSIHIRPGRIDLKDITLHDVNGQTAKLNGTLTHEYFHFPKFDFRISDAHNFLSYNVTSKINPDWYGTIYGNGGASVKGRPGLIEIGVDMSTAPKSTFTFVLSDQLEAEQYSFITFNDKTVYSIEELLRAKDDTPAVVKEFQERMKAKKDDHPSNYVMDIRVDITPDAEVILVMDPVGGDRIRAFGSGDLRMTYNADENDLRMYGNYTLDRGSYNFTLQDIIIKDFTINPGSSITFRGDPYSAQLDLEAVYQVNANLSDLDESFTQDKDLNRTNVPVQALMKVTGDMRQPDIAFDLAFPTLTSDTYRKVRSIISTDDMMNRQIIYLLALNRFYTPDYMASTTKGNELFSVASSTIASQLSNMLGKLSDNWSIAPNLRSDRGDFSDVEVDVALSSRLLNNRLLFNGNFGYRDKSLNTNQFIGDFDIEYLLTPRGTWRLKAYNRYNDQNYYVRTATTTQGVGIMFRRDFDRLFPKRKKAEPDSVKPAPADSVMPVDTIPAK